jgi:hypothetical protein
VCVTHRLRSSGALLLQLLDVSLHPGQSLVSLSLEQCCIPEAGGLALTSALTSNSRLRHLVLRNNGMHAILHICSIQHIHTSCTRAYFEMSHQA